MRRDDGFTLVELLVVMLVIGVLGAIALPAYLNQQKKSQDAEAKHNARYVHGLIERCMTENDSRLYTLCDTNAELGDSTITIGSSPGEVHIRKYGDPDNAYRVKSFSHSGGAFRIVVNSSGIVRNCTTPGEGGCRGDPSDETGSW